MELTDFPKSRHHILVQYKDGSLQWLKNSTIEEVMVIKNIKEVKSYCNVNFDVDSRRWKIGQSQFEKILMDF